MGKGEESSVIEFEVTDSIEAHAEILRRGMEAQRMNEKESTRGDRGRFLPGKRKERTVKTVKEQNFCHEFMRDFNAGRAAKAVGFSASTASTLMTKPHIREYLYRLTAERQEKYEGELPEVLAKLKCMGFANVTDYARVDAKGKTHVIPFELLSEKQKEGISEVTIESDGKVKYKISTFEPLTKLGQHYGAFPTRVEFSGKMLVGNVDLTKLTLQELNELDRNPNALLGAR